MIRIYSADTTDFSKNGLTTLDKCINPQIVEELNGDFSFSAQYPFEEKQEVDSIIPVSTQAEVLATLAVGTQGRANLLPKSNYIQKGNIILANDQPFRIYHIERDMNYIYISARHIFYDLMDNFLEDVRPTNLTGNAALAYILANTQYTHPFTSTGDVGGSDTVYFVRKNPIAAIMGQGGIIETWGGELVRDKFSIGLWQARGNDNGVLIMGGKNIIGIKDILDDSNVITRLMPIGKDGLLLTEKYIDSPYINNYPHPKIGTVEFSDIQDEATLRTTAQKYMTDNKIDIPLLNYSIDFIDVSQTEEYKNYAILQSVEDGDTVTVRYKKLNIDIKAKVIKTTKKYIQSKNVWVNGKVELGNFKPNTAITINKMASAFTPAGQIKGSKIQGIIDAAKTSLKAMADSAETQVEKAILFEDKQEGSPTYGAMALGTRGFMIASVMTNGEWQWRTFGTGKGFIADLFIAGKILGGAVEFDLDAGTFLIGNSTTDYKLYFDGTNLNLVDTPIKISHADGSYTLLNADGVNRYVASEAKEYHYLSCVGQVSCIIGGYVLVQLPDEFKGKDFTVMVAPSVAITTSSGYAITDLEAYANQSDYDIANGTFKLRGNLVTTNGVNGTLVAAYVATA